MAESNLLSGAAFEAIAVAQATYGVPDRLIAQIAQCSATQIYSNRKKLGWSLRKVSTAFLRGGAATKKDGEEGAGPWLPQGEARGAVPAEFDRDALVHAMDQLLWRMAQEMALVDLEDLDELALKRFEIISTSAKQMDRLIEQRGKLLQGANAALMAQEKDPVETARVLKKIEKRVHELAERRAREIIADQSNGA